MIIDDIDFTQHFTVVILKEELFQNLLKNRDIRKQASYWIAEKKLKDNNDTVSKNSPTFVRRTNNGTIRYKYYKKKLYDL